MIIANLLQKTIDNRGKTPPISSSGNYLLEINCIAGNGKYPDYSLIKKHVDRKTFDTWFRSGHPAKGDILIPTVGTLDAIALMDRNDCCIAQNLVAFRTNPGICDSEFLYYLLCNPQIRKKVLQLDIGAVQPSIKVPHLKELDVDVPNLAIQKKIVGILSKLDSKIEANKRINDNLSEQIRTLCNAWLIEYAPFGYECPDDWKLTPLSSIARFVGGYSYKGEELQESTIAMATIKNFERKGGFKLDGYKELVPSGKLKPEHHAALFDTLVAHTDLTQNADVIGNAEPILSLSVYDDIVFSMDLVKVIPTSNELSKFLIAAILQTQKFKNHCLSYVNGTTVLHLSKKALPEYELMLPSDLSVLKPLDDAVAAMYQQMARNIDENVNLAKLRDVLIPRLMSGDLDVSDIEL